MHLKDLLKTGVFGVMTDGSNFVIVNDYVVYEDGDYDDVHFDGTYHNYRIAKLVNCRSFFELKDAIASNNCTRIIYDKDAPSTVETTDEIDEIETSELCEGILMDDFPQIVINGNVENLNITINNFKEEN